MFSSSLVAVLAFASTPAIAANATLTAGDSVAVTSQSFMSYSGGFLWQASNNPSTLTVKITNTTNLTTITSGVLPSSARSIWGSGTSLWVALNNGNVSRVESDGTVTTTIVTGCNSTNSFNNRIHASAEYVTLTCFSTSKLISIDATENTIIDEITTAYGAGGSVVRGPYTYLLEFSQDRISRYLTTDLSLAPRVSSPIGFLMNSPIRFTVDNSHIYTASKNTGTQVKVTRYRFSDGDVRHVSVPGTEASATYQGITSDNTNLFISMTDTKKILSFDFNDPNGPTIADATSPLTSINGGLSYDGTYVWGAVNGATVRFSGSAVSKQLQNVVGFSVAPTSAAGDGATFSSSIAVNSSGGSGGGAINYAIDPTSTATGCALDSPTAPTTLTATSAGTCLIYATKAGDSTYESESSATQAFTFTGPADSTSPVLSGTSSVSVTAPTTAVATYSANEAVSTWGLSGADASLFDISSSGVVTFKAASTAGTYSIIIEATDASGNKGTKEVTVTVGSADSTPPEVSGTGSVSVTAPSTTVATYSANEAVSTWGLSGADASLFDISSSGVVTFKAASTAGTYSIIIEATDASGNKGTKEVTVTVAPGNSTPTPPSRPVSPAPAVQIPEPPTSSHVEVLSSGETLRVSRTPQAPASITKYVIKLSPGGKSCEILSATSHCDIKEVKPSVEYKLTAIAENSAGQSAPKTLANRILLSPSGWVQYSAKTSVKNFLGNSPRMTKAIDEKLKRFQSREADSIHFSCVGFAAGTVANERVFALATSRAKVVCDELKANRPGSTYTVSAKVPGSKLVGANRKVLVRSYSPLK